MLNLVAGRKSSKAWKSRAQHRKGVFQPTIMCIKLFVESSGAIVTIWKVQLIIEVFHSIVGLQCLELLPTCDIEFIAAVQ